VLEDRSHGPDCVLAHIGVAVFQTRTRGGKEGLDEFRFAEFAKESKGVSSDIFVRVLKVVANTVTGEPKSVRPKRPTRNAWRHPYQTKIISCLSLPVESCFGQIS
jgi:hypothetical protein